MLQRRLLPLCQSIGEFTLRLHRTINDQQRDQQNEEKADCAHDIRMAQAAHGVVYL
jgi:hypothetical protein